MKHSSNNLYDQFKACGRLLNEWRDTVGYAGLVAIETVAAIKTGQPFQLTDIPLCIGIREIARYAAWQFGDNNVIAGNNRTTYNPDKLANHALTVSMAAMATKFVATAVGQASMQVTSNAFSLVAGAAFGSVAIALCAKGGNVKSLIKAYDDIMWDFPRKNKGGGGTSLRRLIGRHMSLA